jgi:pimeloyl-ACP methyl ester carboxylesterase
MKTKTSNHATPLPGFAKVPVRLYWLAALVVALSATLDAASQDVMGKLKGAVAKAEFVRAKTKDGVWLHGALWPPPAGKLRVGIVLTGGTQTEFYGLSDWGERFARAGYLTLALNRRDHGARFGYEKLEPSSLDLREAVDLLAERGTERVILVGTSYGTITVSYYLANAKDSRVKAAILYAPLGDLRAATVKMLGSQEAYDEAVNAARQMVAAGRGGETYQMPSSRGADGRPMLHSYEVFLDKRGPDSKAAPVELLRRVGNIPLLAVRDPGDPFPGTLPPAQKQLEEANNNLRYVLLPDTRGGEMDARAHSFFGREEEVLRITLEWLKKHDLGP